MRNSLLDHRRLIWKAKTSYVEAELELIFWPLFLFLSRSRIWTWEWDIQKCWRLSFIRIARLLSVFRNYSSYFPLLTGMRVVKPGGQLSKWCYILERWLCILQSGSSFTCEYGYFCYAMVLFTWSSWTNLLSLLPHPPSKNYLRSIIGIQSLTGPFQYTSFLSLLPPFHAQANYLTRRCWEKVDFLRTGWKYYCSGSEKTCLVYPLLVPYKSKTMLKNDGWLFAQSHKFSSRYNVLGKEKKHICSYISTWIWILSITLTFKHKSTWKISRSVVGAYTVVWNEVVVNVVSFAVTHQCWDNLNREKLRGDLFCHLWVLKSTNGTVLLHDTPFK